MELYLGAVDQRSVYLAVLFNNAKIRLNAAA